MAEFDDTQEQQPAEQQQPFDQEAFLNRMNESIRESLQQTQPAAQPVQQQQPAESTDEFGNYIRPYVQPAIQQANFAAAAAMDYSKFYTHNKVVKDGEEDIAEGTISETMAKEIETTFENMARQNRPASREEIRNYLVGRDISKAPKVFAEKQAKKHQSQVDNARRASDPGLNSQVNQLSREQLHGMTMDQLTKTLEQVEF